MRVRVLVEMDDGGRGIRAVNALDSAMREYNEKLRRADPSAEVDFEVLGVVPDAEVRAGVVAEVPEPSADCPQPCEHLSQHDAREGKTCPEHPCTCSETQGEPSEPV